jgi:peroxiredoxin
MSTLKFVLSSLALGAACVAAGPVSAAATVGQPAPAFSATDVNGKPVSLADFKGKHVVLEWMNPGCPFVKKHYDSGNMPATQKDALAKGAVWLSVNSTAKDASDYKEPAALSAWFASQNAKPTAALIDADGTIGKAYGARTTPHMFIIDPQGKVVYAGAIDSKPTPDPADVKTATNYVSQALGESMAGKPVSKAVTQSYGCSVKYSNGA